MSDKVRVPKQVYDALSHFETVWVKDQFFNFTHIEKHSSLNPLINDINDYIKKVGPTEYARAVIVGYVVEKSVEEKLQDYYCSVPVHQQGPLNVVMKIIAQKYPEFKGIFD